MNIALIIVIVLLLGANRAGSLIPGKKSGTIRYIGSAKVKWGGLRRDYDYRVQINGFTMSGQPLEAYSGNWRGHGGDTWDYANQPDKIFDIAFNNYIEQGGDPNLNWNVITEQSFYDYAKKNDRLQNLLSIIQIAFPNLRATILARAESIYGDLLEGIGLPDVNLPPQVDETGLGVPCVYIDGKPFPEGCNK
tara:strand:+ start:453 stop:1028 length:576 start_codon:yes stop_codon:yes gene_type:complete